MHECKTTIERTLLGLKTILQSLTVFLHFSPQHQSTINRQALPRSLVGDAVASWLVRSTPGSSPGRGHCVVFLGKTLYSHSASLHPGVQMGTSELLGKT